jgi:hypothetical protein
MRFMDHKRQKGRAVGTSMLRGIPLEDFHIVANKLVHVLENNDLSYESYHAVQNTVAPGVEVLAGLNIKEGLDLLMKVVEDPGKAGFKKKMMMQALPPYGANAKPFLEKLKTDKTFGSKDKDAEDDPGDTKGKEAATKPSADPWAEMVKKIQNDKNPKPLISLEEAKAAGGQGVNVK